MNVRIDESSIVAEIEIAASPERIFRALTDPDRLCSWWGSPETYRVEQWRSDLRVGGTWESTGTGSGGQRFRVHGVFLAVDPPRRLSYTWNPGWVTAPETTVTFELVPRGEKTVVHMRHDGFGEARAALEDHAHGWPAILGWLSAYVEREETP